MVAVGAAVAGALLSALTFHVFGVQAKPSVFTINVTGFDRSSGSSRARSEPRKEYSGRRVHNNSIQMVYLHDQTIAVVEVAPNRLLLNCELIEIQNKDEAGYYLSKLQHVSKPLWISFNEMVKLMAQCQELDAENDKEKSTIQQNRTLLGGFNPFSLLKGIIPGTRWCGTGDVAANYYDLGEELGVDRCCRTHDLCPVKIGPYESKYNLTNDALYTKSHCVCDDYLFDCLKSTNSNTARLMGNIYFNVIQVPCIEDTGKGRQFKPAKPNF